MRPRTLPRLPRTVLSIMCLTEKLTAVCDGSTYQNICCPLAGSPRQLVAATINSLPTQVIPKTLRRRLKPAELRAWRAFMLASVAVTRGMDRDSQAANGHPLAEHHVLAVLGEAGEAGMRPTELALASTLTKSGLTRAGDRLRGGT